MSQFVTVARETHASPEVVADIAGRLAAGRSCLDLVESGTITQAQLDRTRAAVVRHWQDSIHTADPSHWVTLELMRLEALTDSAAAAYELSCQVEDSPVGGETPENPGEMNLPGAGQQNPRRGPGDPNWLKLLLKLSESRRKLLGTNAPERKEVIVSERPLDVLDAAFEVLDSPEGLQELEALTGDPTASTV